MTMRVGLVGAGFVSRHHLIGWQALASRATVVAIADPSAGAAQRRAEEFCIAATFGDAEAMLQAGGIDALDVAAPRAAHAGLVHLAARHGIPVLCQKPLAPTLAEAEALVAELGDRVRLMVHENWRFRAYYRQAATWLREGSIGTVHAARLELLTSGTLPGADGRFPALERQPFMRTERRMLVAEVLIHHLDTLRMLLGPLTVTAAVLSRSCAALAGEDGAVIQMRSDAGAAVQVFASFAAHGHPPGAADRMEILGATGAIRLKGSTLTRLGAAPAERHYDLAEVYQQSYIATLEAFIDRLADGRPFETSPEDNLATLRLVEDCYRLSPWRPDA